VLLVEDNKLDVFIIREAFSHYQIPAVLDVIEDGDAAIRLIDFIDTQEMAPLPALILLDLNLPKRSGTEVLAHLRQSSRLSQTSVLVVTSSRSESDKAKIQQLGIQGYFLKPTNYDEFLKIGELVLKTLHSRGTSSTGSA
jgi:chemotaxis family two-component system response regulator Rcp1